MSITDFENHPGEIEEKILIVVGDVHGDYDQLIIPYNLYKKCKNAKLIYLGDFCSYSPDNEKVYQHIVSTFDNPNIIYIRGNHESRNYDRNEYFYKYKALNFRNAYAVDEDLNEVDQLKDAKYLFTHAEFVCNTPNEFETVTSINQIPVEECNDFIYRYEHIYGEEKMKFPFQNVFGHLHAYELSDETMQKFMNNEIRRLCIDIDSSFVFNNGAKSNICFLILKKDGFEVYRKTIVHQPKKQLLPY